MPEPAGQPDRAYGCCELAAVDRSSPCAGGGETDCTLVALHTAAASFAGPGTWLLVGIAPAGTPGRGWSPRTRPRLSAWASLAVIVWSPNVVSISFRVDVCSNGP